MPMRFHLLFGEPGNAMQPSCNPAFGVSHTRNLNVSLSCPKDPEKQRHSFETYQRSDKSFHEVEDRCDD
jgi:hypothetical protein